MNKSLNIAWKGALVAVAFCAAPAYAASEAFNPKQSLTPDQLRAVIDAPLFSAEVNKNVALNPDDPASYVKSKKK